MHATPSDDDLRMEMEAAAKKAGLTIPAERVEAILAGYKEQRRMIALLRQPRTAAAEPSNIYSLVAQRRE